MGNGIVRFTVVNVRGGQEVVARKRSRRGTLYISESVVILQEGKTKKEMRESIADAVSKMNDGID